MPTKDEIFAQINLLNAEKQKYQEQRDKYMPLVKEAHDKIEEIKKELSKQWAVYNKLYKKKVQYTGVTKDIGEDEA